MTRVLVVDDDPDMAALLGQMATMAGFEPTVVRNGEDALKAVDESPPDVVLLDIMMSGLDGWSVYEQLLEHQPDSADLRQRLQDLLQREQVAETGAPSGRVSRGAWRAR